jgi:hypothetical protein
MGLQRTGGDRGAEVQPGGAPPRLKFKRDAGGKLEVDEPKPKTVETVESAERPPTPDDPRTASEQNVPPFGPGF